MRKFCCVLSFLLPAALAFGQMYTPVKWDISADKKEIVFSAHIEKDWHIYDLTSAEYGPTPTEFVFEKVQGAQLTGKVTSPSPLIKTYEKLFGAETQYFEGNPKFVQKIKLDNTQKFEAEGYITYSACTQKRCVNLTEEFSFPVKKNAVGAEETKTDLWRPVIKELAAFGGEGAKDNSWLGIFLICFGGGFVALLMPCIWPIIPLTVSFFLKHSHNSHKKAIINAALYGVSIVIIYVALGLFFTILFGAGVLNSLATNAFVNLFFFALLIIFAISFFGAFELTLPAAWVKKIDKRAHSASGILGIFLMAFTLALVSFSCTGPIIGTLLVQLVSTESMAAPLIGMFGFGLALAIPFALFAFFPPLMQRLPKSGEWLNTLKVVLGFLELALALKFLSVADMAYHWNILNREVFLVLWILIFAALAIYLLKVKRIIFALLSFIFVIYMIPGFWGAQLKDISAFLPPQKMQSFHDYEEGMAYSAQIKKPVLLDFTGYGCVNCRKMEAVVLSSPRVKKIIDKEFVLISLYVDDRSKLPKGDSRTVGDKWSTLQRHKFGANAQPYYVLLDNEGFPIGPWYAFDEDVNLFVEFLNNGLKNYKK